MTRLLLALHVAGGSIALLSMTVPLVSRKGGATHRRAGWVYVGGMALVCVTALILSTVRLFSDSTTAGREFSALLIYVAILTGAGIWAGMRVVRAKRRVTRGPAADIAMAAVLAAAGTLALAYGATTRQPLFVAFGAVGTVNGGSQVAYWLRPPTIGMHWWFAHMGNMLGACITSITAFAIANAGWVHLPGDSLVVWLGPTIVGLPTIAIWIGYYRRRFAADGRRAAAGAARPSGAPAAAAFVAAAILLPSGVSSLHAQDAARADPQQRFEVASVRPNRSDTRQNAVEASPTGLRLTNWALRPIIQLAFGVDQPSKLAGVPPWTDTERFDIVARGAIGSRDDMRAMLRALLAERFRLAAHTEQRQVPVYRLVVARPGEGPRPALHPSSAECAATPADRGSAQRPANAVRCGPQPGGPGRLVLVGSPVGMLAGILSLMVGRPVIDDTGLAGRFDIDVTHASDAERAAGADGPSIFTALQEQLGLRLDPGQQEQEVLVIDRVERPDAD